MRNLIVPTAHFSSVSSMILYYISGTMQVLVSDGTDSAVYRFSLYVDPSIITGSLKGINNFYIIGMKLTGLVLTSVHGSGDLIYSHVTKNFILTATNTAHATTIDPTYTVVNSYLYFNGFVLVTVKTTAGTAGDIY